MPYVYQLVFFSRAYNNDPYKMHKRTSALSAYVPIYLIVIHDRKYFLQCNDNKIIESIFDD